LTIASALIELDAAEAAAELAAMVDAGGDRESLVVEPALARWKHPPYRDVWLARLATPQETSRRRLLLAIDCVRVIGESAAESPLRTLALDRNQTADVRLPAADTLGVLHTGDLLDDARRLAAETSPRGLIDRLVAVHMLGADRSEPVQQLLVQLAVDPQSAVAAVALDKLLAVDPLLVQPLVPVLLSRPEGELRQRAARSLFERPTAEHVVTLAKLLDDPHFDVRTAARKSLQELAARPELRDAVLAQVSAMLRMPGWRGQEQAAQLAGHLDQKPEAVRLLELLESERDEVSITAAWALSRLAVPETLSPMLAFAERSAGVSSDPAAAPTVITPGHVQCLPHLFQAFGLMKHAPAEPLLTQFVPRRYDVSPKTRSAAIWALGHLHAGDPQPELARMLAERVADEGDIPVLEPLEVRFHAAVSLGRMKVADAIEVLRNVYQAKDPRSPVCSGCEWAIEQITGNELPDPEPRQLVPMAPFLQPL
jgi:HEAT repeat protein